MFNIFHLKELFVPLFIYFIIITNAIGQDTNMLRPVDPRIEICSGAMGVHLNTTTKMNLSNILKGRGDINGEISREIRSLLSRDSKLSDNNIIKFQENYLKCIKSEAIKDYNKIQIEDSYINQSNISNESIYNNTK